MKANIEISEETMDRLAGALDLSPLYDEDYGVDEENLSYAIRLMVDLCADYISLFFSFAQKFVPFFFSAC